MENCLKTRLLTKNHGQSSSETSQPLISNEYKKQKKKNWKKLEGNYPL